VKKSRKGALTSAVVATFVAGFLSATTAPAYAEDAHYYILIGGTCDGKATVYNLDWLQGGIPRVVDYPAGAAGAPNCDQTPMDQSVAIGHDRARQVVQDAYRENQNAEFTVVGYSQGAIVANMVLNDIADDNLGVDKSKFSAKLFADPVQPAGPAGTGISAAIPQGAGLPSPFGGYVSFGPGRPDFAGVRSIRYCIQTDGICDFDPIQAAGGYLAQHWCYQWPRPTDGRSIMQDTIADGVYTNASERLPKQDCWAGPVHP